MSVVVDASAAAAIALRRVNSGGVGRLVDEADVVRAPDLIIPELTNTFWKYARMDGSDAEECAAALERAIGIPDVIVPSSELFEEALDLATRFGHPAYDLFYAVVARRHASILATVDRDLRALCRKLGVRTAG